MAVVSSLVTQNSAVISGTLLRPLSVSFMAEHRTGAGKCFGGEPLGLKRTAVGHAGCGRKSEVRSWRGPLLNGTRKPTLRRRPNDSVKRAMGQVSHRADASIRGGFVLAQKPCVKLTVSVLGGRALAQKTVPFGAVRCPRRSGH